MRAMLGDVSATSPQSSPVVYAVGYPSQITDLSASPGNTAITATFTLPPSHGASISRVDYYLNGATSPSGSWSNPGSSGQKVSEQISGLSNGTTYSVQVSACSQSAGGTSGGCGPLSNTASADPYGPPDPPSVSAGQSGNSIVYSWSGGGNNGRPVQTYHICFDSSCNNYGGPGSATIGYGCGTNHSITGFVIDTVGQQSGTASAGAATAGCPPPPTSTVTISRGQSAVGQPSCSSSGCSWVNIVASNFPAGQALTVQCWDQVDNGVWYQWSPSGSTGGFKNPSAYANGAGSYTAAPKDSSGFGCYIDSNTFGGVRVYINGVASNTISW